MRKVKGRINDAFRIREAKKLTRKTVDQYERRFSLIEPQFNQIRTLVKKFGGLIPFCVVCGIHPVRLLNSYAFHGHIPIYPLTRLLLSARYFGVILTPQDIYPELFRLGEFKELTDIEAWEQHIRPTPSKEFRRFESRVAETILRSRSSSVSTPASAEGTP